jgi:hypothetical protein
MKSFRAVLTVLALVAAANMARANETHTTKSGCTITHHDNGKLTIVCPKSAANNGASK